MAAVLFDFDGVLYEGNAPVDGARKAISWFQKREIPHLFLTNTSSRPRTALFVPETTREAFRASDLASGIRPYAVLDSVAELPGWWSKYLDSKSPSRTSPLRGQAW